jgi:hypothetical protein
MSESRRRDLRTQVHGVDVNRILPYSSAEALLLNLRWIVDNFDLAGRSRRREMHYWVERWVRWQAALAQGCRRAAPPASSYAQAGIAR